MFNIYIKKRGKKPSSPTSHVFIYLELNMTLYMIVKVKNVLSCLWMIYIVQTLQKSNKEISQKYGLKDRYIEKGLDSEARLCDQTPK